VTIVIQHVIPTVIIEVATAESRPRRSCRSGAKQARPRYDRLGADVRIDFDEEDCKAAAASHDQHRNEPQA